VDPSQFQGNVGPSHRPDVPLGHPTHHSYLHGRAGLQSPDKLGIPGKNVHPSIAQKMIHQVSMCCPRHLPSQLHTGVPSFVVLCSQVTAKVPQHTSIVTAYIQLYSLEHLYWTGKLKSLSHFHTFINEACSLDSDVLVHVPRLVQDVPKVDSRLNPFCIWPRGHC
jgi:hypothetical protein